MHRLLPLALLADAAWLVLFAALGRRSHDETGGVAETLAVAWPFLAGWALGALAGRLVADPLAPRRAAVAWAIALPAALALRAISGRGIAPGFIVVAALFGAVTLIGWRAAVAAARQRRLTSR